MQARLGKVCDLCSATTEAIIRIAGRRFDQGIDPFLCHDLTCAPPAVVQDKRTEPRVIAATDKEAATPVAAAGNRLHATAINLHPCIVVAKPFPRIAGADRIHDVFFEDLRQRFAKDLHK